LPKFKPGWLQDRHNSDNDMIKHPTRHRRATVWQALLAQFLGRQPAHAQNRRWLVVVSAVCLWMLFVILERNAPVPAVLQTFGQIRSTSVQVAVEVGWLFFSPYVWRHLLLLWAIWHLVLRFGAAYLCDLFELPAGSPAYQYLVAAVFGVGVGKIRVQQGGVLPADQVHPIYTVGGPGNVEVYLGNAAVFERLDGSIRIAEAGLHTMNGFERLRTVLDLRYQHLRLEEIVALSRDGVQVSIEDVQVRYRLSSNMAMTPANPFPLAEKAALVAVYQPAVLADVSHTWQDTVKQFVCAQFRNYLNAYPLDTHLIANPTEGLRHKLTKLFLQPDILSALQQIGVAIEWVGVGTIRTDQVSEQQIERHKMAWLQQLKEQPNWQTQVYTDAQNQTRQQWVQGITTWYQKQTEPPTLPAFAEVLYTQLNTLQKYTTELSPAQQAQFADLLAALRKSNPEKVIGGR
jgi:hypothetical protein